MEAESGSLIRGNRVDDRLKGSGVVLGSLWVDRHMAAASKSARGGNRTHNVISEMKQLIGQSDLLSSPVAFVTACVCNPSNYPTN